VPIVLAFACAVVYGVADYCGGRATRSAPSVAISLLGQVTSLVLALAVVLLVGTPFPAWREIGWGAMAGVASAVALAAFYHAMSHGSMTVVAPITAVTSAVLPVGFGLLRGDRPAVIAYVGMVLALAAIALVSGAVGIRHTQTTRSTIVFAIIGGIGFAWIFIALGETTAASGIWPLVSARVMSVTLTGAIVLGARTNVRGVRSVWRLAVFAGLLDMSANFLYLLAVRRGLLSIVVVVVALYPVSTVVLAFRLDRERVSRSQAVGMAMALGALVLVSIAGAS
jgi:drug/metabolite transporter (DMT)-like permease